MAACWLCIGCGRSRGVRKRIQFQPTESLKPVCFFLYQVVIEFAANYTLPEIVVTGYNGVTEASVREITKGIDSIFYLGGGR